MHVERILSINNGWAILGNKKREYQESLTALSSIDDEFVKEALTGPLKGHTSLDYLVILMQDRFSSFLTSGFGWAYNLELDTGLSMTRPGQKPNKNGVFASILGTNEGTGGDFTSNVYLAIPYYFSHGIVDVVTLFIPTADAVARFKELGCEEPIFKTFPTEEFCRLQLTRFAAFNTQAPITLAFFSPNAPEEINIEEVASLQVGENSIERTLEFAPEYYQASIGLLSYFGNVLRQKDPDTKAKVRIEQEGNRVRLHIESPDGKIETIEEELAQYALVISGQAVPETLLANRAHIMQLETQLDIARIQIKQSQDLMQLAEGQYTQRINNLEKQVEFLQTQFAAQILQTGQVINLATKQNESHERLQTALLTHSDTLFKDLLREASGNQQLIEAVSSLHRNLLEGITTIEIEDQLEQALSTIKQSKPGFLSRISSQLEGAVSKEAAGSALKWVMQWIEQHQH